MRTEKKIKQCISSLTESYDASDSDYERRGISICVDTMLFCINENPVYHPELFPEASPISDKEPTQFTCGSCGDKWNLISPQSDTDTCPRCGTTVYSDKLRSDKEDVAELTKRLEWDGDEYKG